jgi:Helix-turn-helix of insertion element transposase
MKLTNEKLEAAAVLVAEDSHSDEQIAAQLGITRSTLATWKTRPEFAARVDEVCSEFAEVALKRGIARKEYRMNTLANMHSKLLTVMEERAADPDLANIPGGNTGLIVRKAVVSAGALVGYEYAVDTGLLRELRAIQEQAAKELGQLVEKRVHRVIRNLRDLTDEELAAIVEAGAEQDEAEVAEGWHPRAAKMDARASGERRCPAV